MSDLFIELTNDEFIIVDGHCYNNSDVNIQALINLKNDLSDMFLDDKICKTVTFEKKGDYRTYSFIDDSGRRVSIRFHKAYMFNEYTEYQLQKINLLNELHFAYKRAVKMEQKVVKARKNRKLALIIAASLTVGALVGYKFDDIKKDAALQKLEDEIAVHTGLLEIGGYKTDYKIHVESGKCLIPRSVFDDAGVYTSFHNRISQYCIDNDLGIDVRNAACDMFDYAYDDEIDKYREIDLHKVYKRSMN